MTTSRMLQSETVEYMEHNHKVYRLCPLRGSWEEYNGTLCNWFGVARYSNLRYELDAVYTRLQQEEQK